MHGCTLVDEGGAKGAKVVSVLYLAELVFTKSDAGNPIQNGGPWERTYL
jgi:hypothetical protein